MLFGRIERVEDPLCSVLGNARPGVCNGNLSEPPVPHRCHGHGFLCLGRFRCRVKTIQDQIGQDLLQLDRVTIGPKGAPFSSLRKMVARDFASGDINLSVSAT